MESLESIKLLQLRAWREDGCLVPVEGNGKDLPFQIGRIFYVYDVPAGHSRGKHAHFHCHQVLICLRGRIRVVCDDGRGQREFVLDSPDVALHVPPGIWAEQIYETAGAVLLVITDRPYEATDYIREYDDFLKFRNQGNAL